MAVEPALELLVIERDLVEKPIACALFCGNTARAVTATNKTATNKLTFRPIIVFNGVPS